MNNIGPQCWPTWLQPSDDCEIMTSCQVCWRIRRWHNGRTRHSPNPEPGKVSQDCLTNGEESAAHSILARSDSLQQRPHTFAQTNLVTSSLFRLRRRGGPYIPDCPLLDRNRELISRFNSSGWFNSLLMGLRS